MCIADGVHDSCKSLAASVRDIPWGASTAETSIMSSDQGVLLGYVLLQRSRKVLSRRTPYCGYTRDKPYVNVCLCW